MDLFWALFSLVVLVFFIFLIGRLILDWLQILARDWRPRGPMLVVAEAVYTVTDPPLRALRRILPSPRFGGVRLDLAFLVLFLVTSFLMNLPAFVRR